MPEENKSEQIEKPVDTKNTADITLINSRGDELLSKGPCCDKEIKAICKIIHNFKSKKVRMKNHA